MSEAVAEEQGVAGAAEAAVLVRKREVMARALPIWRELISRRESALEVNERLKDNAARLYDMRSTRGAADKKLRKALDEEMLLLQGKVHNDKQILQSEIDAMNALGFRFTNELQNLNETEHGDTLFWLIYQLNKEHRAAQLEDFKRRHAVVFAELQALEANAMRAEDNEQVYAELAAELGLASGDELKAAARTPDTSETIHTLNLLRLDS